MGGKDPQDALSCRSFFAKEPLIIGLFCGKWPMEIRHPMTLRHSVTETVYMHTAKMDILMIHELTKLNTCPHKKIFSADGKGRRGLQLPK